MRLFGAFALRAFFTASMLAGSVLVLPAMVGPASAQMMNLMPEVKSKTPEQKEQDEINDKAYRDSLRQIPDNKGATDPWGNVRADTPKAAAKPAKQPRTRTGSAAQ